jgi:hypothetical protein
LCEIESLTATLILGARPRHLLNYFGRMGILNLWLSVPANCCLHSGMETANVTPPFGSYSSNRLDWTARFLEYLTVERGFSEHTISA